MRIIGLTGTRQSGKDTFFNLLRERDPVFRRYAFADALKLDLQQFIIDKFGFDILNCSQKDKELARSLLIAYGCAQREVDIDYWVKRVHKKIITDYNYITTAFRSMDFRACVTDFRFVSEVEFFREKFDKDFKLINIIRFDAPPPSDEEEKNFRQVAQLADYNLAWGQNTVEQQREEVRVLMGKIIK